MMPIAPAQQPTGRDTQSRGGRLHQAWRALAGVFMFGCVGTLMAGPALAETPPAGKSLIRVQAAAAPLATATAAAAPTMAYSRLSQHLKIDKSYALGVANYYLDHATKVTGWQVSDRWFFGRQRGVDSGLTLVWQQQANQVSVSKEGVRYTRRF